LIEPVIYTQALDIANKNVIWPKKDSCVEFHGAQPTTSEARVTCDIKLRLWISRLERC